MKRIWSCKNPPGPEAVGVALDAQLAAWSGPFLRSLRRAASEQGCVLVLLCKGGHEFTSHVAEQQGFHHVVDYDAMGDSGCSVIRQLCEGVAVVGSVEAMGMLWAVRTGIIFNPKMFPAEVLTHGSAASAARIEEADQVLRVFVPTRVFRDGPALKPVGLDQVLPVPLAVPVQKLLVECGYLFP